MNIMINSVKFKADSKLEKFVTDKVSKLERTFDNITSCDVILKVDKPETDNNKIAEIQLVLPGQTLFNSKQADSFEEAVLQAVDATKNQLSKYKEKFNKKNGDLKTDLYESYKLAIDNGQTDSVAVKSVLNSRLHKKMLKGKTVKTIGGFIALALAIKPIDNFVEHILIGKVINNTIENIDKIKVNKVNKANKSINTKT